MRKWLAGRMTAMNEQVPADDSLWPETVRLRDCKIHDDLGGLGQRIYTTAGAGYEKREYVRGDIVTDLRASLIREQNAVKVLARENERLRIALNVACGENEG